MCPFYGEGCQLYRFITRLIVRCVGVVFRFGCVKGGMLVGTPQGHVFPWSPEAASVVPDVGDEAKSGLLPQVVVLLGYTEAHERDQALTR